MQAPKSTQQRLRKCGVILTCMDHGKKRFKAVAVQDAGHPLEAAPGASAMQPDQSQPSGKKAPVQRSIPSP